MGPSIVLTCGDVDLDGLGSDYSISLQVNRILLIDHSQYSPVMETCAFVRRY
jgi:hypothetical protein